MSESHPFNVKVEGELCLRKLEGSPTSEVLPSLSEGVLFLGKLGDSCRHCFPALLNIVKVGS